VNCQSVIGVQASCGGAISFSFFSGSPSVYSVSGPRSFRLSWMLFRARLAKMLV
jgi:hypothetical protein